MIRKLLISLVLLIGLTACSASDKNLLEAAKRGPRDKVKTLEASERKKSNPLVFEGFELRLELNREVKTIIYGNISVRTTTEYARFHIIWRSGYHLLRRTSFIRPIGGMEYPFEVFEKIRDNVNRYVSLDIGEIRYSSPPVQFEMELTIRNPQGKLKEIKSTISVKDNKHIKVRKNGNLSTYSISISKIE